MAETYGTGRQAAYGACWAMPSEVRSLARGCIRFRTWTRSGLPGPPSIHPPPSTARRDPHSKSWRPVLGALSPGHELVDLIADPTYTVGQRAAAAHGGSRQRRVYGNRSRLRLA